MIRALLGPLAALVLAAPVAAQESAPAGPSPAVVAMRWQWLNPEINSFTFRDTDEVFEFRDVPREGEVWPLERAAGFAMPDGYERLAERTFTNALLVIRDGKIVFEDYRNRMTPDTRHVGFSMSKTIVALLVGIALDRGEIASLDDPVARYLPELAGSGYDAVSVRQVLQMRSGVDYQERYDFGDNPSFAGRLHEQAIVLNRMRFVEGALETKRATAPGSTFNYSTLDTFVLGWLLERVGGKPLAELTQERLWAPLGAEADAFWLADGPPGAGRELAGMGYNATLRDFGRLGQLMLQGGVRDGSRIVPDGWLRQMTAMLPTGQGRRGYGFQAWQVDDEPGAFAAVGLAGQLIYVHPASRTVVVKLSFHPPVPPAHVEPETMAYLQAIARTPSP